MTGFQSKRQASKALLQQALDTLLCCSPDSKVSAALQTKTVKDLRAELAEPAVAHPDPWREAIDAELICTHLGTVDSFHSANEALDALINWHIATALDPAVSASAKLLVDRGRAQPQAEPVAWQFRWTNPGVNPNVSPEELEWRAVDQPSPFYSLESRLADLREYRFAGKPCYEVRPLYAAPQAAVAEPLTHEQIEEMWEKAMTKHDLTKDIIVELCRAVEAAHGIKGSAA